MENQLAVAGTMDESSRTAPEVKASPLLSIGRIFVFVLKEVLGTVIPALIIAFLLTHFVGQKTIVLTQSMEPSLCVDQQVIVDKVTYHFRIPDRGEIVVINVPESEIPYIKRVIGLPGETVEIKNNRVWIDGAALSEPYGQTI